MSRRTESLLPTEPGRSGIPFARGVRAGPWVFATGVLANDFLAGPVLSDAGAEVEWLAASPDDRPEAFSPPALAMPTGARLCPAVRRRPRRASVLLDLWAHAPD